MTRSQSATDGRRSPRRRAPTVQVRYWLWAITELRTTRCVARHSGCPYSVWSLGNFHCEIIRARQRESMPNHVRRDCQRSITATIPTGELKLKLERNHGCCFTATTAGKPSSLLCLEAAYRPVQKGPMGPMVPLGEAPDDEGSPTERDRFARPGMPGSSRTRQRVHVRAIQHFASPVQLSCHQDDAV